MKKGYLFHINSALILHWCNKCLDNVSPIHGTNGISRSVSAYVKYSHYHLAHYFMLYDVREFCIKEKGLNLSELTFRDMDLMGLTLSIVGRWTERSATEESNNGNIIAQRARSDFLSVWWLSVSGGTVFRAESALEIITFETCCVHLVLCWHKVRVGGNSRVAYNLWLSIGRNRDTVKCKAFVFLQNHCLFK